MSVVFPQPDGPIIRLSSPACKAKSTPRSATVFVSPAPNVFVTRWQETAAVAPRRSAGLPLGSSKTACMTRPLWLKLAPENDGRFQHEHAPGGHKTRRDHNDPDGRPCPQAGHPGHMQSGQLRQV